MRQLRSSLRLCRCLVCLLPLVVAEAVVADYLEVRRSAHLRAEPDVESLSLIVLEPGTLIDLVENEQVNGYYLAALAAGDEGWVYRTLVRRYPGEIPPAPSDDGSDTVLEPPLPEWDRFRIPVRTETDPTTGVNISADLVIGSWNIKWFGQREPEDYDLVTMADIIEECDLVAIQELRGQYDRACLESLLAELNARNRQYTYRRSRRTGYDGNADARKRDYVESFAFIWDSERLRLTGEPRLADVPIVNHPVFRQVPYVASFEVTQGNGFDFSILTTHTVYNARINFVRAAEIRWIRDWMLDDNRLDGEENLIAIGDFNANPPSQSSAHHFADIIPDGSDFRVLMYESESSGETPIRTTVPTKDSSSNPTYFSAPVYDHILVTHATSAALPADPMTRAAEHLGVVQFDDDPWWMTYGWSRGELIRATSDHRPIWFKLDYFAEDNDP